MRRIAWTMSVGLICAAIGVVAQVGEGASVSVDTNSVWQVAAGQLVPTNEAVSGSPVLTVGAERLVLDSGQRQAGSPVLHALVRLRTESFPSATALFAVGKKDVTDKGLWMQLGVTRGRDSNRQISSSCSSCAYLIRTSPPLPFT